MDMKIKGELYDIINRTTSGMQLPERINEKFLLIPRSELPGTKTIGLNPLTPSTECYIEVDGADHSRWNIGTASATLARRTGLEYLAAAEALENVQEQWRQSEKEEQLRKRRDRLVMEHGSALGAHSYDQLNANQKYLVDRLRVALDGEDE